MKKILVTGGAGFIGSHVCERLLARGDAVTCLDNFFTGQRQNIAHLQDQPGFTVIEHDITLPIQLNDFDQIYNLACPASPLHYQVNPIKTVKTSTLGVINMLGIAKKSRARILQASTSEVYGDPEVHPQPETYVGHVNPLGPRACYDEGKRIAETLCMDYHRHHGVDIRIARIFNTYGPRMQPDDGRVISNFIVQALANQDLTIYGQGNQTRSFCYVDDLVAGLILLMDQDEVIGPVNLGNPEEITVSDLAGKVVRMTGSSSRLATKPLPADDPRQRQPDITLAKKLLRWQPAVPLDEGLRKTISYFRRQSGPGGSRSTGV